LGDFADILFFAKVVASARDSLDPFPQFLEAIESFTWSTLSECAYLPRWLNLLPTALIVLSAKALPVISLFFSFHKHSNMGDAVVLWGMM